MDKDESKKENSICFVSNSFEPFQKKWNAFSPSFSWFLPSPRKWEKKGGRERERKREVILRVLYSKKQIVLKGLKCTFCSIIWFCVLFAPSSSFLSPSSILLHPFFSHSHPFFFSFPSFHLSILIPFPPFNLCSICSLHPFISLHPHHFVKCNPDPLKWWFSNKTKCFFF